jgi:hypothetical protein
MHELDTDGLTCKHCGLYTTQWDDEEKCSAFNIKGETLDNEHLWRMSEAELFSNNIVRGEN